MHGHVHRHWDHTQTEAKYTIGSGDSVEWFDTVSTAAINVSDYILLHQNKSAAGNRQISPSQHRLPVADLTTVIVFFVFFTKKIATG